MVYIDPKLYESLESVMTCEDVESLYLYFTYETDIFGERFVKELIPGGD